MNELAQNLHGARVETHPQTRELAIYKFNRPGGPGAPAKVVGPNRLHLHVPPNTSIEDFQRLVNHQTGRYKMIQVDEFRRPIDGADAFYLDIMDSEPARGDAADEHSDVIRELARANSHMVEVVAERFAAMMDSAATLIRAADGAGLPAREPIAPVVAATPVPAPVAPPAVVVDPEPAQPSPWTILANVIGQAGPLIQHVILTKVVGLPPEVALKMTGAAMAPSPTAPKAEAGASAPTTAPLNVSPSSSAGSAAAPSSASPTPPKPVVDPDNMMAYLGHLATIESLLSKREATIARELITVMDEAQTAAWKARICAMTPADAATAIRAEIAAIEAARQAPKGGVS